MEKRRYGRGGLYKRGRVWWIKYYVNRYPVYETARTRDKRTAEDLLKQRLAEAELNQIPDPVSRKLKVEDVLTLLVSDYRLRNRASLKQLESRVNRHLLPMLGSVRATEVGQRHIELYVQRRREQEASDTSINRELEHLRAAFRFAVEEDLLPKAPKIRMLEEENVRTGFLEHWQYEALRSKLPPYLVPLFVTAYHVGCRLGELMKLTWEQVDFDASQIWLDKKQTKGKVARVLPIYGDLKPVLETAHADHEANWPNCRHLFHHNGRRIVDFRKAWARACTAAGVPWLRFHDLRRSAVRNMDRAGIAQTTIRRIIGHETDAMFDRYRIVDQRDIHEAGQKAAKYLEGQEQFSPNAPSGVAAVTNTVTKSTNLGGERRGTEGNCAQFCDQTEGNSGE